MTEILVQREIAAPLAKVWEVLADFGGVAEWMPGAQSCVQEGEGVGATRTVSMGDIRVIERLESLDEAGKSFSYSVIESPMPLENYLATVRVRASGSEACKVDWSARFDLPAGVDEAAVKPGVEGAYGGALDALKSRLE